jgi:beta-galactosidase
MPDRIQAEDARIIRYELNCNMVRCSHYPQSEAFLDACDEIGLLAWEEAPGWGYLGHDAWLALADRDIADMIVGTATIPRSSSGARGSTRRLTTPRSTAVQTSWPTSWTTRGRRAARWPGSG